MSVLSKEFVGDDDTIIYLSIFELAVKVFYLPRYRKVDGFAIEKNLYCNARNEFIEKFRLKYPQADDSEIFNFLKIYLLNELAENSYEKSEFLFDERIPIKRISWMGPYLQEKGDCKYSWLVQKFGGRHTPSLIFFYCKKGNDYYIFYLKNRINCLIFVK